MAEADLVDEWLEKADEDFQFAASVLEESPFYAQICFHFHQAAEKYLKSFIIARNLEFKKIPRSARTVEIVLVRGTGPSRPPGRLQLPE